MDHDKEKSMMDFSAKERVKKAKCGLNEHRKV